MHLLPVPSYHLLIPLLNYKDKRMPPTALYSVRLKEVDETGCECNSVIKHDSSLGTKAQALRSERSKPDKKSRTSLFIGVINDER